MSHPAPFRPGKLAQLACILEATARKPGNVHRYADFEDTSYLDYLLSATAIVEPLDRAITCGVGQAVLDAIEATRRVVTTNTNLGMVLLFAPLAAVPAGVRLEDGVSSVLASLSVVDAGNVYHAIRLAHPGGLGTVSDQDVATEPSVTLLEAMELAAERDIVARQYANGFADVFRVAVPALKRCLARAEPLEQAIATAFLTVLAAEPDTLIARKRGWDVARDASRRARAALEAGTVDLNSDRFRGLDTWLREDGHARNPGATADLIAAALFAALRDGTIPTPDPAGPAGWSGFRPLR